MEASFALLLIVVGGYLAAHVAFGWLARRFNMVSGAEYLLLGILLGPQVSGLLSASTVGGFAPFLTLALGWIGVVVGSQFYLPELMRISSSLYRIAFAEATLTLAVTSAAMIALLHWLLGVELQNALEPGIVMGCIATASSPTGIALMARKVGRFGPAVRQLQLTTAVDALVAITAFGLLLALRHTNPPVGVRPLTPTEWAAVSIAIGFGGGALFHLFLGAERKIDRLVVGLIGAVMLCSGAAAYLRLSPLLPAMLVGMILVNTSSSRVEIRQLLTAVERPIYFVLLIFAGAAWAPTGWLWAIAVVGFLLTRRFAKLGSAAFAAWANDATRTLGPGWGHALLGQGGLAIAIALNYQIYEGSLLAGVAFTSAIASVLVTDLTSARVAERVIRSAGRRLRLDALGIDLGDDTDAADEPARDPAEHSDAGAPDAEPSDPAPADTEPADPGVTR